MEPNGTAQIERLTVKVTSAIADAFDKACPKKIRHIKKKSNNWYTAQLLQLKRTMNKKYKMATRHNNPIPYDEFRNARRHYYNELNKCKRNSWREYCSNQDSISDSARLVKVLKNDGRGNQV